MSNQCKATSGPWEYEEHPNWGFKIWGDHHGDCSLEVANTTNEANAWLIASAPELLRELEAMVECFADIPREVNCFAANHIAIARMVIKKAKHGDPGAQS